MAGTTAPLIIDIAARTQQFESSLRKSEGSLRRFEAQMRGMGAGGAASAQAMAVQFDRLNRSIGVAGATFTRAFGAGVGIGLATQLPAMMARAVSSVGDLSEAAEKAGVSIRDLQKIQFAGLGSGLQLDEIVQNLAMFNKRIGEAATKGGDLAKLFEANGLSIRDNNGQIRDTVDLLAEVADLVKNARSEQERTVIATTALGRGGAALIPFLMQGSAAMRQLMKNAEDAGFVIDEKLVRKADEFSDKWTTAAATFGNIWKATLAGVAMDMEDAFNGLAGIDEFLREWTGKGLIKNPLSDIIDPQGKSTRDAQQKIEAARRFQENLEAGWRERVDEREILRQQPQPLDELGQRRLAILDEEIGRYDRLIVAHKKFIDQLRSYAFNLQPDVRPPPGTNSFKPSIVPVEPAKPDKAAAADANKLQDMLQGLRAQNEALALQNALFGQSDAVKARAAEQQRLLNELARDNIALTPQQKAELDQLLGTYQSLSEASDALAEHQEAMAESSGALVDGLRETTFAAVDDIESAADAALKALQSLEKQLLDALLFGGGPFAKMFGTAGQDGAPGGVLGNLIGNLMGRAAPAPSLAVPGLSVAPSQQLGGVLPGLSAPGLPSPGELSNADYFAQFRDAIPGMAKKMLPSGVLAPFFQGGGGAGPAVGAGGLTGVKGQVWNYFAEKGLAPHQIAGIMGNIQGESAFNPLARNPDSGALGLFQHLGSRKTGLLNATGGDLSNVKGQLDFAWGELQGPENRALRDLMSAQNVRQATGAFAGFERAGGWSRGNPEGIEGWQQRLQAAQQSMAQSGQRLSQSLSATAQVTKQAGSGFAGQFPNALQEVLSSIKAPTGGGGFEGLLSLLDFGLMAGGGPVRGKGTGTSDSNLKWLSNGEFVVNSVATAKHRALLDAINSGDSIRLPSLARGTPAMLSSGRASPGGGGGMQIHYHDHAGVQISSKESSGVDGVRMDVMIEQRATAMINRQVPKMLRDGYGLKPTLTGRV
jgi:hypothetical protein